MHPQHAIQNFFPARTNREELFFRKNYSGIWKSVSVTSLFYCPYIRLTTLIFREMFLLRKGSFTKDVRGKGGGSKSKKNMYIVIVSKDAVHKWRPTIHHNIWPSNHPSSTYLIYRGCNMECHAQPKHLSIPFDRTSFINSPKVIFLMIDCPH